MTVRQAVALALLLGAEERILDVAPSYIVEKVSNIPPVAEVLLDQRKKRIFYEYAKRWKLNWSPNDLNIPIDNTFGEPEEL